MLRSVDNSKDNTERNSVCGPLKVKRRGGGDGRSAVRSFERDHGDAANLELEKGDASDFTLGVGRPNWPSGM